MESKSANAAATQPAGQADRIRVWDPLVRIFHWSLVGFFTLAWLSAEEIQFLHEWSGYAVAGLVAFA